MRLLTASQETDVIARYVSGQAGPEVAAAFGISTSLVSRTLRRRGVTARTNAQAQTKHTLRHDALDVLTPDAAYWCGMMFTDGSISQRPEQTPEVSLTLSECDLEHVEKLRSFLGSTHAITRNKARTVKATGYHTKPSFRFAVRSAQLAQRLRELGRYEGPIDSELAQSRDFWRGVVDGDGSIQLHRDQAQVQVVGSSRLLSAYAAFMACTMADTARARPLTVRPTKAGIHVVSAGWATAERIVDLLYTDAATALTRKAEAAERIRLRSIARPCVPRAPRTPRTRCRHGHKFTPENTYVVPKTGVRQCRKCNNRRAREFTARKKAARP